MEFNPHLKKHIDAKSLELVELMSHRRITPESSKEKIIYHGSVDHKSAVDISDKIVTGLGMTQSTTNYNGIAIDRWFRQNGDEYGFDQKEYVEFRKAIGSFYKDQEIIRLISFKFLLDITFDWVLETKRNGQAMENLSDYLTNKINSALTTETYCFPILNLEISEPFNIGPVTFKYFTREDFDQLTSNFDKNKVDDLDNPYPTIREMYEGMVVASSLEYGERGQAEAIARARSLIAIDLLKICSDTLELPDMDLSFDIDMRAREQLESQMISHGSESIDKFNISKKRLPRIHQINSSYFSRLRERQLPQIAHYVFSGDSNKELHELIVNAIANFGDALSTRDLNKRVVELFSIYESLLIPNDSSPIQDSLNKYGTKLIFKTLDDRRGLKSLFIEMYKVRSAMVHHGKRKEFDIENLRKLQLALFMLIIALIKKSVKHDTKASIIAEIDDAIDSI
jgi:hypothetical protein